MDRLYQAIFRHHFDENRQMLFVMGARQSGKTTVAQSLIQENSENHYFNWDDIQDRDLIVQGPQSIAAKAKLNQISEHVPLLVFDEIHKYKNWRDFIKGLYDAYPKRASILVTGSAKLGVFNKGGDSLMGRYFPFHFHPLSLAEISQKPISFKTDIQSLPQEPIDAELINGLIKFGPYPDPFLKQSETFSRRWQKLRQHQLIEEDIRDLTRIHDIDRLSLLAEKLKYHVGSLVSYQSLATQLRVSDQTVRSWISTLINLYYCFAIRPWSRNVNRSLLKEPKYYLWDWTLCPDESAQAENMIALHLLKAVHFWNDLGLGNYDLHFIRDKEKREVDFLISKNSKPFILIEVKLSDNQSLSKSLLHFSKALDPDHTFQVVIKKDYVHKPCFVDKKPLIVPASTFLAQLI